MAFKKFSVIGLAKENESPENPGALEKRVALVPSDVKKLVRFGIKMFVETGAGTGIGYSDQDYIDAGATIQPYSELYKNKEMIIKFNGPSLGAIPLMKKGTTLFCMAHFDSIPKRSKLFERYQINVVAMEEIVESPKKIDDERILSKKAMNYILMSNRSLLYELNVNVIGYNSRMIGAIRRAGNRNTNTLFVYSDKIQPSELENFGSKSIYFFDSKTYQGSQELLTFLRDKETVVFDLAKFESEKGRHIIKEYRENHPPYEYGKRRIECLHEVGMAGARYGASLLLNETKKIRSMSEATVTVLGYGNVGMGAINECYLQGVKKINVLSKHNSTPKRIKKYLKESDLIINAALLPLQIRGELFLITKEHVKSTIQKGAVVIDLIGGNKENRSPVESILEYTYFNNPYFIENGIYFSSLWGWPLMCMKDESAHKYSAQITSVLIEEEMLIKGLDYLRPGVKRALVCGPFEA